MDVKLNILDGSAHRFCKVVHLPCIIGRSRLSNISIVHPLVSRQHCEIYEDHGLVMVRDLGSLNGTFYKDVRIGRGIAIPYGEVFSIGTLHFVLEKIEGDTAKMAIGGDEQDENEGDLKNGTPSPDAVTDKVAASITPVAPVAATAAAAVATSETDNLTLPEEEVDPFVEIVSEPIESAAESQTSSTEQKPNNNSSDDDDLNFDDILSDLLG